MRLKAIGLGVICVSLWGCGIGQREAAAATSWEWYEGGTLQQATMRQWREAPYRDRLATAADLAARYTKVDAASMDAFKPKAEALERCLSESASSELRAEQTPAELASACALLLWSY